VRTVRTVILVEKKKCVAKLKDILDSIEQQ
jgi:hypothetical protein